MPARFATATSKMSFARSPATVVASISASFWFRGWLHVLRGHDAAKEPGGVHAITAADERRVRSELIRRKQQPLAAERQIVWWTT